MSEVFSEEICLETDSINNEEKRKWGRKANKKNCSSWLFWPNCGSSRTRCKTPCPVFFLLYQIHFLIIGLNKRPQFPHRQSLAHQTSIWPSFVSVNSYFKTPCTWGEILGLHRGLNWNIPSRWFRRRRSFCTFLKKLAVFVENTAEWPKLWPGPVTLFESCLGDWELVHDYRPY